MSAILETRRGPFGRLVHLSARFAPWMLLLYVVLTGIALRYTLTSFSIETDREAMLSPELPFRKSYARLKEAFPRVFTDQIVLVVDADTPELAERTAKELEQRLQGHPELFVSVSLPPGQLFFEEHGLLYLDVDELQTLSDRLASIQPFLGRLSRDTSLRGLFGMLQSAVEAKADGDEVDLSRVLTSIARAVHAARSGVLHHVSWQELMQEGEPAASDRRSYVLIEPVLDYSELFPAQGVIDFVRRTADELGVGRRSDVRLRLTGGAVMADDELHTVSRGAEVIAVVVFVLVAGLLILCMRSLRLVTATLLVLVFGLILSAAAGLFAVGHFNLISIAFAALYLGLGVDYAIHFCLRYQQHVREGLEHLVAMTRTGEDLGGALTACAATTTLAFLAFTPTSYSGVSELGIISGIGMVISLLVTFSLLPALLSIAPMGRKVGVAHRFTGYVRVPAAVAELPLRHWRAVRIGALCVGIAALALLPRVRFDYNPLNLSDPTSESVKTFIDLQRTSHSPPWSLSILAPDRATALSLEKRLAALPAVSDVRTLDDFVPGDQDAKLELIGDLSLVLGPTLAAGDREAPPTDEERVAAVRDLGRALRAWLATERDGDRAAGEALSDELVALDSDLQSAPADRRGQELGRLSEDLLSNLPVTLGRLRTSLETDRIRQRDLPADLARRWISDSGLWRVEVFPKGDLTDTKTLERFVDSVQGIDRGASDSPAMMLESGRAVVRAFQEAFTLALAAMVLVLVLLLRNLRDTFLVLVPLLLGGALTGAATVVLGIPFNHANVIALPLLLGTGIDNGIHIVHRFRSPAFARESAVRSTTTRAILFSTLTTLCSFASLAFSHHLGTASLGILLGVGTLTTLGSTLVVLPALLAPSAALGPGQPTGGAGPPGGEARP